PRPIVRARWVWLLLWAPMAPVLFLQLQFAWRVVYQPEQTAAFADWTPLSVAVTTAYTIAALAILAVGYRGLTDRTERRRVRLIVRLGLQYALGRRVLVSIVPGTIAIFMADLWFHREIPFADILLARGWRYLGLAALAIVARVRRNDWLDGLDRRFFRERFNAQRLLRGIGDEVRTASSLDAVAARGVAQI